MLGGGLNSIRLGSYICCQATRLRRHGSVTQRGALASGPHPLCMVTAGKAVMAAGPAPGAGCWNCYHVRWSWHALAWYIVPLVHSTLRPLAR